MAKSAAERARAYIARKRIRARGLGLCGICCKEKPNLNRTVCSRCRSFIAQRTRRKRQEHREVIRIRHILAAHEEAGDLLQEHHLYADAAQRYQLALSVQAIQPEDRLRIAEKFSHALFLGLDPVKSFSTIPPVVSGHESVIEKAQVCKLLDQQVLQMTVALKIKEASALTVNAIKIAQTIDDSYSLKRAYLRMVDLLEKLERFHEIDYYLQAVEKIQQNDGMPLSLQYYMLKGIIASAFGKADEMYAMFERALHAVEKKLDLFGITALWQNYGQCAMQLGNIDLGKACIERALLIARQNQVGWRIPDICAAYAFFLVRLGQYGSAHSYMLEALSYEVDVPYHNTLLAEAGIPLALRMKDEAMLNRCAHLPVLDIAFRSSMPSVVGSVATAFAQWYAYSGETRKARRLLHRALQIVHRVAPSWDLPLEIARRGSLSDIPQARSLLEARIELPCHDVAKACLSFFDALVAQRSKQPGQMQVHAEEAVRRFEALHWYGYANEARTLLSPALAESEVAPSHQGKVLLGISSSLTPREQEVAELVLKGLTSRAIGEKLSISPNTVNSHINSIMNRLGLRSRYQLQHILTEASD